MPSSSGQDSIGILQLGAIEIESLSKVSITNHRDDCVTAT